MNIQKIILVFSILLALDFVWFSFSLKRLYEPLFSKIQKSPLSLKIMGGLVAWTLLATGITLLVLPMSKNKMEALSYGLLFGLIVYGVYNGTNYATFIDYDAYSALYDTLWGTFACGMVSYFVY